MFPLPKGKPEFSKLEEAILQKWKAEKTFEKSVESRPAENPYRFYDGPPFITGTPHYGSLLSSIIKDVVPRYQTMLGKRVERVWGWDCHGMPIEQKVQAKLGLESNKAIEESEGGIQHFVDECYNYTRETSADWAWYIDHIGRWVDMDHAYRTMDQDYMESVMWVFKQIWEKGYVYEGKRVSWYSWKLSTPISNFEIAMDDSYQDVQDPAVTIKFPIHNVKKGSGIIIQDEAGKLLMIKNKKDGLWRFPGGKTEPGESYHAGAARELLEETEITCELTPYCSTYIGYRGEFYEALSFRGVVPVGHKVILEDDKFSDYEYFSLDALPVHSEIHRMEHDLIDFLTGVREPVIVPEIPEVRKVNILAWTTTPWTLPMHMALAVNKDLQYVSVYHAEEIFILSASRVETVFKGKGEYQVLGTIPGEELVGLKYQPPFDYYQKNSDSAPLIKGESKGDGIETETDSNTHGKIPPTPLSQGGSFAHSFKVYHADFVTDTDGTGIAHEAPEFGDVDFQLAKQEGIHITSAIDEAGKYTAEVPDYQGQLYIDVIDPICERLKSEGTLFKKESITHRVPYCPRSNTPLMQRAQKSWFIDIQRIKGELIAQNESINWFPDHFKHGRFLKSLESAPDWCISRSRFWGTPMPIWQNKDGSERVVIGSREELYQANKPLGQITKVIVLRHAESEANEVGFYDDIGEFPLSETGKQQAQDLVEKLASEGIEVILSSPFVRTLQTAEPIAKKLGITIRKLDSLREINHGKFGNLTNYAESRESRNKYRADPDYKFGETGESQNDIRARMQEVVELIKRDYAGKTVLVVTHGFPSQGLLQELGKEKMPEKYKNASYGVTYLGPDGKEMNLHRPTIDGIYLPSKQKTDYVHLEATNEIKTTKFIFVRHGESTGNVEQFMPKSDTPLTKEGEKQAQELSIQFQNTDIDIIISSPFLRAQDTIAPLAKKLNKEVILDTRVREWDSGEFAGTSIDDEKTAEIVSKAYNDPTVARGRGECMNQLLERGRDFIDDMQKQYPGKTILVLSHYGFMRVLFSMLKEDQNWLQKKFGNCEVATICFDNTGKEIHLHRPEINGMVLPEKSTTKTRFILVRHGELEEAFRRKYDSVGVANMSDTGKKQIADTAKKLIGENVSAIISSPLSRCQESSEILAQHLNVPIEVMDNFTEIQLGKLDGQNFLDENGTLLIDESAWTKTSGPLGETGETFVDFETRIHKGMQKLEQQYVGKTVIICTHGSPINAIREYFGVGKFENICANKPHLPRGQYEVHEQDTPGILQCKEGVTKVILLRHAQTEYNIASRCDNSNITSFSELGKKQIEELKKTLPPLKVDKAYCSPMERCINTIGHIYDNIHIVEDLTETKLGSFDNQIFSPEGWVEYCNNPQKKIGETGESYEELCLRVKSCFDQIIQDNPGKTVLIVTHGSPIGVLRDHIGGCSFIDGELKDPVLNATPMVYFVDNKTGKKIQNTKDKVQNKGRKVLGIHGWTSSGLQKGYEGKWLPLQDLLKEKGIQFDVPNFDQNKETTYAKWRETLEGLDMSSYDTILATSFGCPVIMQYLCEKNIHLKRLVLVAPSGLKGNEYLEKVIPEMIEDVEKLRGLVDEIIITHSEDDDSKSAPFTYGKSLSSKIGATFLPINGVGHAFGGWNIQFLSSLVIDGVPLSRIPEVLDVWMDSASMPYAQVHYPFENLEKMEASFPADFIAEYTGQIRAWFYVMHTLGVILKGSPAFKNVAVTGVINGTDGRKMSKSYGNYPDPKVTIEQYGADALRFYLMGGPIMRGEDMNFSETGIAESLKKVLLPLWNSYTFFATYANIDKWEPDGTEIWFTRHGKSEANEAGVMSGAENDTELSEKGREQVSVLQQHVEQQKAFDTIICSPRKRTVDTISGLGAYILDADFLEQKSGEFDGMKLRDIGEQIGTHDVSRIRDAYRWNKVEPWDVFYAKISGAIERVIAENKGKKILFCAHAGVFRAFTQYFSDLHNRDIFYGSGIKNACLYRFPKTPKTHELDTWIISQLHNLIADTRKHMDNYDTQKACDGFVTFLDGLNNWYIRRNRRRFWRKEVDADKCSAYETLHEVLTTVCQLLAPICPFITEHLYSCLTEGIQNTKDKKQNVEDPVGGGEGMVGSDNKGNQGNQQNASNFRSVHLTYFPEANPLLLNLTVNQKMRDLQNLTNLGLAIRGREKLRVRQPLRSASITLDLDESARATLAEELNVKEIHTISDIAEYVTITYSPDAKQIGASDRRQWMKTIIADAKAGKGILTPEGTLEISIPDAPEGKIILTAEEFETVYTPKEGSTIAFVGNAGYVIGLDTTLDEALTFEGYARDLIRAIQDTRKEMGFQVTDRLQLSLASGNSILTGILVAHKSLIEAETLCTLSDTQGGEIKTVELDEDFSVEIKIEK